MSKNLSRRDFLKLTLTSLTATFLAACGRALGIPATPSLNFCNERSSKKY